MKLNVLLLVSFLFGMSGAFAQELPAPSPKGTVSQMIGLTNVTVDYSRPGVKGRTIWGDLVPYDNLWRTGANKATAITFDSPVKVNGKEVAAGTYSLFTIPGKDEWTVILNSETELWGTGGYKEENDVARVTAKPQKAPFVESMLFMFDNVKSGSASLSLVWAELQVSVQIETDYVDQALANIDAKIREMNGLFRVYHNAASFYLDNELDTEKALEYARKSVELDTRFWNVKKLSEAHAAAGNYKEAIEMAERSLNMSQEAGNQRYVSMNEENIAKWKSMR